VGSDRSHASERATLVPSETPGGAEDAPWHATPLTPLAFLERAATCFAERTAVVDGGLTLNYRELAERARRLAAALARLGIAPGERVATLCLNSHVMLELYNGVPLAEAVLVPMNTRLAVAELAQIVEHSGARLIVSTEELAERAASVCEQTGLPLLVAGRGGDYEGALANAEPSGAQIRDEHAVLAINYTSGSTGRPKGVLYSHRGAYLQALAMLHHARLELESTYLWTLPMFHCNGWCFTWAVTAAGATHRCLRQIDAAEIWTTICEAPVTHLSAAPTVLLMIAEAADRLPAHRRRHWLEVSTGGSPPPPALLARLRKLKMRVTHLYGLTETYGPCVVNQWQPEWSALGPAEQARLNARQGIGNVVTASIEVVDKRGATVPADGATLGEIVIRGNNVMLGYYRDEQSTRDVFAGGVLHTGDVGVRYPDGYVELRDRAKDVIITGGENVASIEVEQALAAHPAVYEAAVVACPDATWGEVPVAFVTLRDEAEAVADAAVESELIEFVRSRLARFKAPKRIVFGPLPKTSTGKVQKHLLRARLRGH
jgi:fatty-acyl-CoA synthase